MKIAAQTVMTLTADRGQPLRLTCESGLLWITIDGEAGDLILQAGDEAALPAGRRAVVQALRASVLGSKPCRLAS